jgi:hypothetical protein
MRQAILDDIAKIRGIRVQNNDLWMEILLIACKAAPDQVWNILSAIRANDQAVGENMTSLVVHLREQQERGVLAD